VEYPEQVWLVFYDVFKFHGAILHVCPADVVYLDSLIMRFVSKHRSGCLLTVSQANYEYRRDRLFSFLTRLATAATLTPVISIGLAMHQVLNIVGTTTARLLLVLLLFMSVNIAKAQMVMTVPVNIFGDGNPENGIEDSREQVLSERGRGNDVPGYSLNAGTIKCDGDIRGTAMVVDTSQLAPRLKGVVLVTAAHVLYDLKKKQRFKRCKFHYLGMERSAGYRAKIDLRKVRLGDFDPGKETGELDFGEGDWAFLYIPRPWKKFSRDQGFVLRDFSSINLEAHQQSGGGFSLIAFDSKDGVISVSRNCTVNESVENDLGGGRWKGQLLDDCDSVDGASGGGIIAVLNKQRFLIGIRTGSHWNEQVYPASEYPLGPPGGSVWSPYLNTNFGRAIDAHLLHVISAFIQELKTVSSVF
jgi:hypothetical protein